MVKTKEYMRSYRQTVGSKAAWRPADESTQAFHKRQIQTLDGDSYPDGTYNLETLTTVEYDSGYQVTFCQIGDDYTDTEYADRVNEFLAVSSDGITSAGKFGGTPEVSFNVPDRETAIALGKKYNQNSVLEWSTMDFILTGGTGRRDDA